MARFIKYTHHIKTLLLAILFLTTITFTSLQKSIRNHSLILQTFHNGIIDEEQMRSHASQINLMAKQVQDQQERSTNQQYNGNASNNHQNNQNHEHKIPSIGLGILFIFGTLLYSSILKFICRAASKYISISFNALLLLSGILLGVYHNKLGMIGQSTNLISRLESNQILAIFLPCLIFSSGFNTQWHTFKKMVSQSLILGILSSLASASLIMIIVKLLIASQDMYTWQQALLMGSILTCTDLLSFLPKLKRSGAPVKITSLIQGQSLFNYCTCVLTFQYYIQMKQNETQIPYLDYLSLIFSQIFGGIFYGVVMGAIMVYCIKRMIYDGPLVVTLIIIFSYTIYLTAQYSTLPISGIISLTIFSLYMNAFGKTEIFGETLEYVNSFWNYLVFVGQTSIFIIAGVFVGANIMKIEHQILDIKSQLIMTLYIYLCTLFSRFLSIGMFKNLLKRYGQQINWRQISVLTFAGLKGPIGIALSMYVYDNDNQNQIIGSLIMIHVTTNSIITLLIHDNITRLIIKMVGLSSYTRVQYKFFHEYLYSFEANILQKKQKLKQQKKSWYQIIQWNAIQKQIGIKQFHEMFPKEQMMEKIYNDESKFQKSQMFKLQQVLKLKISYDLQLKQEERNNTFDLEVEYRKRFIKDLIAKYWEFHQNNFTSPAALMLLIQSANSDLDTETEQLESWDWIKNQISFNMKIFSQLMKLTLINSFARSYLFSYVSFCYDVVSSYIKANEQVRQQLELFYINYKQKNHEDQENLLRIILKQSQANQKEAQSFLTNYLQPSFPQIEKEVKTRKVSFSILHNFKDIIDRNNAKGQLEPNQYDMLNNIIYSKLQQLNLSSPKWEETDFLKILEVNSVFKYVPEAVLQLICSEIGQKRTFDANQKIMEDSQIAKYFYFVKKGGVNVEFTNGNQVYRQSLLAGQVFGFQCLITNIYHSSATANIMTQIIQVKKNLMRRIFDSFPSFQEEFWKVKLFQCYKMFVKIDDMAYQISHLQKEGLSGIIANFKLQKISPKPNYSVFKDTIFIRGLAKCEDCHPPPPPQLKFIKSQQSKLFKQNQRISAQLNYDELLPFSFLSRQGEFTMTILEPSYFLTGEIDYQLLEDISHSRMSNKSKKISNKKSTIR